MKTLKVKMTVAHHKINGMNLKFIFYVCSGLLILGTSNASDFTSGVVAVDFGNCVVSYLNAQGAKNYLTDRQKTANANRKLILRHSPKSLAPLEKMNLLGKTISQEAALASLPLIDFSKLPNEGKKKLSKASMLFMKYCKSKPCEDPNLVSNKDWPEQLKKSEDALKETILDLNADEYSMRVNQVLYSANPIVDWLLKQKQGTVDHGQLLQYATDVFNGDVLTALAVIGELFKQETSYTKDRAREAVLASKMKKLVIEDDKFSVGLNYHFWQLITASIIRNGTTLGKVYGTLDNNEPAYKFANQIASKVADVILDGVGKKDRKCFLTEGQMPTRLEKPASNGTSK